VGKHLYEFLVSNREIFAFKVISLWLYLRVLLLNW